MTAPLEDILRHLTALVGVDTTNPPRAIASDGPLIRYLTEQLPGFDIKVTDCGDGSVIVEAKRGNPTRLFNVHLDTVPVADGWTLPPHQVTRGEDRVHGLGVCDIKGAAACLLTLAAQADAPMHLLFTTDEEAGQSTCVRTYLETPPRAEFAIVAEPTGMKAVTSHRGIVSARMTFSGESGHASQGGQSALHDAARWVTAAIDHPDAKANRLNVGRIEGGVKPNMIAAHTELLFGFRNLPGVEHNALLAALDAAAPTEGERIMRFVGPALPSDMDGVAAKAQAKAMEWIKRLDLELADPVDFFTEAAFFAQAGIPVMVLGPGHIAQAHTADEWVTHDQLLQAHTAYERIIHHG